MRAHTFALAAVVLAAACVAVVTMGVHPVPPEYLAMAGLAVVGADLSRLDSTALAAGLIVMEVRTVEQLRTQQQELLDASQAIVDKADEEGRDLTEDEIRQIEDNGAKVTAIGRQIFARESAAPPSQGQGRRTVAEPTNRNEPEGQGQQRRTIPAQPRLDNARHGFRSFGAFALAVRNHLLNVVNDDVTKLRNAASTYGNEGTGAEGGFLVPPQFSTEIWQKVQAEENLLNRCTPLVTDANSMMIPKDETTPWQTSGGVQVYWEGEAAVPPNSKPLLEMGALRLAKLMGLVPVSEELLQDASGLESWLRAKAPAKMAAKINTAIIAGTGVGQPLGIIPSYTAVHQSVVSVAKETSQPADTVWFANVNKMWARMYAGWRRNAVWLINQDVEPQLEAMAFAPTAVTPTAASLPVYLPPGGLADTPYARLKGRPVVPIEACATIGDLGDIILADLTQYWALTKSGGGVQTDTSIHLYFDQALTAFRFIFRVNGQPAWSAPIVPQNGTLNRSWAVTLDAR